MSHSPPLLQELSAVGPDRPKLRSFEPIPIQDGDQLRIALKDSAGLGKGLLVLTPTAFQLATLMDGTRTPAQICQAFEHLSGQSVGADLMDMFLEQLDSNLALDNHRSRGFLRSLAERPAAHQGGAYPAEADELRDFLQEILSGGDRVQGESRSLRGLMIPHIDLGRGARSYGFAFRELQERLDDFDTFVILGISHAYSVQPFILTRLNFATPLGVVETDQEFVDQLASGLDFDPFEDEFNHLGEHSVEFQAVFLRYLLRRPIRIVPILCGSFHRCLSGAEALSPRQLEGVDSFLNRLQSLVRERPRTLVIASVDLAHQGERFGGPSLDGEFLRQLEHADHETLARAVAGDSEGFIAELHKDRGERNYCGTPAIYTMLEVLGRPQGRLHCYQQCNEPGLTSTVTVAAAGFYGI